MSSSDHGLAFSHFLTVAGDSRLKLCANDQSYYCLHFQTHETLMHRFLFYHSVNLFSALKCNSVGFICGVDYRVDLWIHFCNALVRFRVVAISEVRIKTPPHFLW